MLGCLYGVIGKPLFQRILIRTVTSLDGFMRSFWELEQRQFFSFSRHAPQILWFRPMKPMVWREINDDI